MKKDPTCCEDVIGRNKRRKGRARSKVFDGLIAEMAVIKNLNGMR